ncbi:hypothetical protein HDC37_000844 [Microbacterium sp. AK009]|nr:hypothetical protein [Microbacterium sp. AK009]
MTDATALAAALGRALALFSVHATVTVAEDHVLVPNRTAEAILSDIARVDGAGSAHRVRSLLHSRRGEDVQLTVPDAAHLVLALEDGHRQKRRNEQIDRGQIPGPMSSAEVMRLARRHPGLFRR